MFSCYTSLHSTTKHLDIQIVGNICNSIHSMSSASCSFMRRLYIWLCCGYTRRVQHFIGKQLLIKYINSTVLNGPSYLYLRKMCHYPLRRQVQTRIALPGIESACAGRKRQRMRKMDNNLSQQHVSIF